MILEVSTRLFFCSTKLDEAERKVEILLKDKKGQLTEKSFQMEDNQNQSWKKICPRTKEHL